MILKTGKSKIVKYECLNYIGYGRIVLAVLSCMFMPCCPGLAFFCYLFSALLDAVDGHAARHFNQSKYAS